MIAAFWYVVAHSEQLRPQTVLSRTVLGEWLAVFRGEDGQPVALRDRCMHRHSRLSSGKVTEGQLHCPYHGWVYDQTGQVVAVPAEGERFEAIATRCAKRYATCEQDGYVYVRLASPADDSSSQPFVMPHWQASGWETVRVVNRFNNTVTNCVENFIDIPHTAFVHPGVFRRSRQQQLEMTVTRQQGCVTATYCNESTNLGWFSRFLNPGGYSIRHVDRFFMPNITCVEYDLGPRRKLWITSQSVPETEHSTLVYTDVTFHYGLWSKVVRPLVRWTAQHIIQQDVAALAAQQAVIEKYGQRFSNTPADTIHEFVESIRQQLEAGKDPTLLPDRAVNITFWV